MSLFDSIKRFFHTPTRAEPTRAAPRPQRQVGAIPFSFVDEDVAFLLVTSRRTGRWKFPKGSLVKGCSAPESAEQEAFEEAGVKGLVAAMPVGAYHDQKIRGQRQRDIEVELYPLEVTEELLDWPEKGERRRHWASLAEVERLVADRRVVALAEEARRTALRNRATPPPGSAIHGV